MGGSNFTSRFRSTTRHTTVTVTVTVTVTAPTERLQEPPGALSQLELDPITTKSKTAIKQEAYIFFSD